ncbi:ABC transporter ATP-binding protein [Mesorhizobium sp. UC22_110]|uniref:ABC transporter ATP-binding protein n=1 Tax=unclassified Mesorhizobium TaxID=325217 RepID=UPI00366D37B5
MMLSAVDLAFGYPGRRVGSGATFSVAAGEVFCLLGPNGCGKTTLFKTVLGLLPALGGRLDLDGIPVSSLSRRHFAQRVAYVPQATAAHFPFSVFDVALMGRASRIGTFDRPSASDRAIVHETLTRLGIAHLGDHPYTEISGGERQMTLVARALVQRPAMIVMDEPTASLDFGNQARILSQILALKGEGIAVVLSTHEPSHAFACAGTVALMSAGTIVASGTPDAVLTPEALSRLYGVDVTVARLSGIEQQVCVPVLRRPILEPCGDAGSTRPWDSAHP